MSLFLILAAGCGGETVVPVDESYNPEEIQGKVDESLPTPLKAKQAALKRFLGRMVEGIAVEDVRGYEADLDFTETEVAFWPADLGSIARWKFDGKPTGNDVPIEITFSGDDPEAEEQPQKRVYTVTGRAGNYTIARKK